MQSWPRQRIDRLVSELTILNNLAKVSQLKVISRTSVMQYRGEAKRDMQQIAAALGVANVLEGTVRRDGNHVRVSTFLCLETKGQQPISEGSQQEFMNELEFPFEMPVTRYRMKKLPQSAGANAQNSQQRMQRRNYQVGGTKKRSVFLSVPGKKSEPENSVMVESCAPKGKPRRKLKRGQPNSRSKLTAELSAKICGYVADGMSWQDAASMVGVHRNVISIWKAKGDADPQSEYGVFLKSAEEAELRREQVHLKFISQDKDWKARRWLLCNFRPEKYRMTSFSGELVGKDGLPLFPAAEKQFSVVLDVHAQPANGEPVAEAFRIVKPDGSAELWQPNGERPPHS